MSSPTLGGEANACQPEGLRLGKTCVAPISVSKTTLALTSSAHTVAFDPWLRQHGNPDDRLVRHGPPGGPCGLAIKQLWKFHAYEITRFPALRTARSLCLLLDALRPMLSGVNHAPRCPVSRPGSRPRQLRGLLPGLGPEPDRSPAPALEIGRASCRERVSGIV